MTTPNGLVIDLGFKPRGWQQKCIDAQEKYTVLAVHRRAGKTVLASQILFSYALKKVGMYSYIMPELKQGRFVAWPVFKSVLQKIQGIEVGGKKIDLARAYESDNTIRFSNGSEIRLLGADNPDSIRGAKLAGTVMDEVAQMPREVWTEVVMPALLDSNGWALFIGTPKGVNLFSELFYRGLSGQHPGWKSLVFTVFETDALTKEQIDEYRASCTEEEFKREMLCDFNAGTEDQLISLNDVLAAMERYQDMGYTTQLQQSSNEACILGVDVSRYGNDRSVIFMRCGMRAELVTEFRGKDTSALADAVRKAYEHYRPAAIYVDGTGVGGGVVDQLRARNIPCFDVNFSSSSSEAMYNNKRTEIWCRMAEWIKNRGCLSPLLESLKTDLPAPLYSRSENGVFSLESKKEIRKRLGLSPDLGDALALTFSSYIPEVVAPRDEYYEPLVSTVKVSKLSPFEQFEQDNYGSSNYRSLSRLPTTLQARLG